MLRNFKAYQLALLFHHHCEELRVPNYLRDQLLRASSSVVLNIAEGSGKPTSRDQCKFYAIALGSLRESQAALDIARIAAPELTSLADRAAHASIGSAIQSNE